MALSSIMSVVSLRKPVLGAVGMGLSLLLATAVQVAQLLKRTPDGRRNGT